MQFAELKYISIANEFPYKILQMKYSNFFSKYFRIIKLKKKYLSSPSSRSSLSLKIVAKTACYIPEKKFAFSKYFTFYFYQSLNRLSVCFKSTIKECRKRPTKGIFSVSYFFTRVSNNCKFLFR